MNAYRTEIDNLIATVRVNGISQAQGVDQARIRGLELLIGSELFGWQWNANYSLMDAENRSPRSSGSGIPYYGKELNRRPSQLFNLDIDRAFGDFSVGTSLHAQNSTYDDLENQRELAGFATLVEFVFAPPAISLAIGAYLGLQFPTLDPKMAALGAYVIFITLNALGVGIAAMFELIVTLLAVGELLVFAGVVAPGWSLANFTANGWAGSDTFTMGTWAGIFASIPFAIWFFLAIEGAAMAAEEAKEPRRTIPIAYITGILTLVALAFLVMVMAGGVGDWTKLSNINDPLPQAMKMVVGESSGWLHMLVWIGLFGLVASFHGIVLGYSRQMFALARAGYLPAMFAKVHPRFRTPVNALVGGGIVGIAAVFSDQWVTIGGLPLTANIVTMAVLGALVMYIMSMASLFKLRATEPKLDRPFRAPLYPLFPAIAIGCGVVCLAAVVVFNQLLSLIFLGFMAVCYLYFRLTAAQRDAAPHDAMLAAAAE
mgnify:CR=1 FL=1